MVRDIYGQIDTCTSIDLLHDIIDIQPTDPHLAEAKFSRSTSI